MMNSDILRSGVKALYVNTRIKLPTVQLALNYSVNTPFSDTIFENEDEPNAATPNKPFEMGTKILFREMCLAYGTLIPAENPPF